MSAVLPAPPSQGTAGAPRARRKKRVASMLKAHAGRVKGKRPAPGRVPITLCYVNQSF